MKNLYRRSMVCVAVLLVSAAGLLAHGLWESGLPGVLPGLDEASFTFSATVESIIPWARAVLAVSVISTAIYLLWLANRLREDTRRLREGVRQLDCRRVEITPDCLIFREMRECAEDLARVADQIQAEQGRLTDCASRDHLTGLPNRRTMVDRLAQEVATAKRTGWPVSVIMVDLDHFKNLNDTHGHQAGDFVLKRAADRMASQVRQSDTVARFGGEEFAVILPNAALQEAAQIAHQLRDALRCDLLVIDQQALQVSASFGVAELCECGASTPEELVKLADVALYQAKENGRDTVVVAARSERVTSDDAGRAADQPSVNRTGTTEADTAASVGADTMALMGSSFSLLRLIPDRHRVANDLVQQVGAILDCERLVLFLEDTGTGRYAPAAFMGGPLLGDASVSHTRYDLETWIDSVRAAGRLGTDRSIEVIALHGGKSAKEQAVVRIPLAVQDQCVGVIEVSGLSFDFKVNKRQSGWLSAVCVIGATALRVCEQFSQQDQHWTALVEALGRLVHRDQAYKYDHALRVGDLAVRVAGALGDMNESSLRTLRLAALLHDIGEVTIPANIRGKKGPLRPNERQSMQQHCQIGADILGGVGGMDTLAEIVLRHHEHFDGSGYPSGLRGDQIPLGSRIIAVAAAYSAMTSARPYRTPMPREAATARILAAAGTQFDPVVVDAFISCQENDALVASTRYAI